MKYTLVIGLEVHVELNTKSKMFCSCANDWFGTTPNSRTCPVCLGLPGALPVPNKKAIEGCIKIGMALGCDIPLLSKFDRKNYFYPDLAKGYQISQFDQPFTQNGLMTLSTGKKITINRAHMEEDTGKLLHETIDGEKVSLIDFNRSGVPLVEIVTGPDFESATEVKEYLQRLQQLVRYLGVADGDMEKGGMRLEPNISLRREGETGLPKYKVEVKNINSFSFVEKAIEYEAKRQADLLDRGETPAQETRGWDEDKKMTISQRSKEEAADYRYFPEPDIPPFVWKQEYIDSLRAELPELPDSKKERFIKEYGLSDYNAEILTRTTDLANYFEACVRVSNSIRHPERSEGSHSIDRDSSLSTQNDISPTKIANTIINKKVDIEKIVPAALIKDLKAAEVTETLSTEELHAVLKPILLQNQNVVTDYKNGKVNAIMFLVGQAMRELKGKAKADTVRAELAKLID